MSNIVVPLICFFLLIGCKSKSQDQKETIAKSKESPAAYNVEPMSDAEKAQYANRLSSFFDSNLIRRGFNGSILVAKGGNILYEAYIGYKNPQTRLDTIDKTTAFHLASTSKPFTGMAVLRLIQDNQIGLNDLVSQYFPAFPYAGVTVANLLSHRSGLPNYLYVMEDKQKWDSRQMITNEDVLSFLETYKPKASFAPGTHFNYCNTNFVLLALIVEKVTGKKFPAYIKETIFDPLQMTHTFIYTPDDSGNVVMSYKPSNRIWENDIFENTYGDKNVYSTPEDLLKWDRALYNPNFIRPSLLDSAYQPQSHEKPSIHNYGLAWRMLNLKNGKKMIYHNGKWHGFTPAFARLIDEKAVIIILGNKLNANIYNAARKAYDIFGDYMQADAVAPDEGMSESAAPVTKAPVTEPAKPKIIPNQKRIPPKKGPVPPTKQPLKKVVKKGAATTKIIAKKPAAKKKK